MNRKIFLAAALLSASAFIHAQSYTQESTMSVMGTKCKTQVEFSVSEKNDESLMLTVSGFSYRDKSVGTFSLALNSSDGGKRYRARNTTVQSEENDRIVDITVTDCTLDFTDANASPVLSMKYKPGKMPFAITLGKS